jgi:hydroxymethylglutaryl-CoA lyase
VKPRIVEVGPRDGLQNEKTIIDTAKKIAFVDALSVSGPSEIEVTSFVAADRIPQLADAEQVLAGIQRRPGIVYSALVPNERGFERALALRPDKIAVFTAASETFNQKNIKTSIAGSFERFAKVLPRARAEKWPVRGYVSTAFWCPYEGKISPQQASAVIAQLFDAGVDEVSIGDTIGKAVPEEVDALLDLVLAYAKPERIALHFHDTYGNAVENVRRGYQRGITTFDASAGGLGGCPYAPGAKGNVATDIVVRALRDLGAQVDLDLDALARARALLPIAAPA